MSEIIEDMTGSYPHAIFRLCWKYITPFLFVVSLIYSMVEYQPLTFNRWYVYPAWANGLGWLMTLSSILLVPAWALGLLWKAEGNLKQRWCQLCSPKSNLPLTRNQRAKRQLMTTAV